MTKQNATKSAEKVGLVVMAGVLILIITLVFIYSRLSKGSPSSSIRGTSSNSETSETQTSSSNTSNSNWSQEDIKKLAEYLSEKGVILYYGNSCPHCHKQLEMFNEAADLLKKVDCYLEENLETCNNAKIEGVPTWVYGGERKEGVQDLDELAAWVGFKK